MRLYLFLGLIAHKLVWETMKRTGSTPPRKSTERSSGLSLVKTAKVAVLGFLLAQTLFLDVLPIAKRPAGLRLFGGALYLLGLLSAILARIELGKNWADVEEAQVLPEQQVVSSGIYRYIRHPIYTGDLLLLAGLELALNSWLVLGVLAPLLVVVKRAKAEEAILSRSLPDYAGYIARTKRFIPFLV